MFADEDLLPISALQHLLYCPRQCALIHVERVWAENLLTFQGRQMHEKADKGRSTRRSKKPEVGRNIQVVSRALGIWGKCDVVEFRATSDVPAGAPASAGMSSTRNGPQVPFPIEYKRGKPKSNGCDRVQLCAQAMCLEEMTGTTIEHGAIFYGITKRRIEVPFEGQLREQTIDAIRRLREMIDVARVPAAEFDPRKCKRCSLIDFCMPENAGAGRQVGRYVQQTLMRMLEQVPT
jgi:CRISPR-associated exonuclease Cas4